MKSCLTSWIQPLQDVQSETGGRGREDYSRHRLRQRASTILMAKAFPKSQFFSSTTTTNRLKRPASPAKALTVSPFATSVLKCQKAKEYSGKDYDFVAVFRFHHDMGDPIRGGCAMRRSLAKDGTWMIVEPANDQLKGQSSQPRWRGLPTPFFDAAVHALLTIAESHCCARRQAGESRVFRRL